METKYNFDFIFAPDDREEQLHRMRHAINGIEAQMKDAEVRFAGTFLLPSIEPDIERRYKIIGEVEQCMHTLLNDPRTVELGKWVTQQNAEKLGSTLANQIIDALTRK